MRILEFMEEIENLSIKCGIWLGSITRLSDFRGEEYLDLVSKCLESYMFYFCFYLLFDDEVEVDLDRLCVYWNGLLVYAKYRFKFTMLASHIYVESFLGLITRFKLYELDGIRFFWHFSH